MNTHYNNSLDITKSADAMGNFEGEKLHVFSQYYA